MLLRHDASAQTDQEEPAAMPGPESFRLVRQDDAARGDGDRARDEGRWVRRGDDARDDRGWARHEDRRARRHRHSHGGRGRVQNEDYERLGREALARHHQPPSCIPVGRADLWCCGEDDITAKLRRST